MFVINIICIFWVVVFALMFVRGLRKRRIYLLNNPLFYIYWRGGRCLMEICLKFPGVHRIVHLYAKPRFIKLFSINLKKGGAYAGARGRTRSTLPKEIKHISNTFLSLYY